MSKTFGKDEEVAVSISEQVNETGASSDDEAPVLTLKKSKKNRSDKQVAAFEKMRAAKAAKDAAKSGIRNITATIPTGNFLEKTESTTF